ncbi:MAG: hypothetical protein VX402_02855 [Candidatus Thermoplasmatota archaeon]|jgi:hypothetical protein|nr:hypothetical protein [Candidatus Thermoplasmatota archaeon]
MSHGGMDRLHRHLSRFIAIDILLLVLMLTTSSTSGSPTVYLFHLIVILMLVPLGVICLAFMIRRRPYGISLGIACLGLTGSAFLLIGGWGVIGYLTDSSESILFPVLLTLLGVSTLRKIPTMKNPSYMAWYGSQYEEGVATAVADHEVLATCPTCHSILAVIPDALSSSDMCPNCRMALVLSEDE